MKNYFSINYFENEKYRIKKIKDEFLDKFEINEIEDELIIKRVDQNKGWGANLRVKIFNKVINEEFIQKVGDSEKNIKKIKLKTTKSTSHYENDIFKLYVISNYNDIFNIKYNEKTKRLKIIRIDKKVGWNQNSTPSPLKNTNIHCLGQNDGSLDGKELEPIGILVAFQITNE